MDSGDRSTAKLLKKSEPGAEREDVSQANPTMLRATNILLALAVTLVISYALLPGMPVYEKGAVADRDIIAPSMLYVEYEGPEKIVLAVKVNKGDRIIRAGERVNERTERILREYARRAGIGNQLQAYAGLFLLVLALVYLFYRDIRRYRPALILDRKRLLLVAILLVLTVVMTQVAKQSLVAVLDRLEVDTMTIGFALPASAGAMLVCLMFDFHLALGFSFVVSMLLGILFPGDPFLALYYFLGSITAALSVIQCKKRTALLKAGGLTALVNVLVIIGIDVYSGELATRGPVDALVGVFSAAAMASIVSAMLPVFESLFDIATDIKLLELLDPNHPLLKELVYKSPGTYHHSIVIGNLAEAAAEAIGENSILARVGAYYHDIGKTLKPEYFIENQRPSENKHDRLMPSMSSLIIAAHVKEGAELARENRIPSRVVDIIQQHHGTSLITYFYQKAREQHPFTPISEVDYRYAGPRPRTKVAAIVMLADNVEAASRTLDNPTPEQIQALTNSVITRIFLDDQLSMCDLTLRDLRTIAKSFNLVLTGIFHHRIDYPGIVFAGDKRRSEHPDKKPAEEAKAGNSEAGSAAREAAAEHRHS